MSIFPGPPFQKPTTNITPEDKDVFLAQEHYIENVVLCGMGIGLGAIRFNGIQIETCAAYWP